MKAVEKIKTHILCSITAFRNSVVYEIMCKNIAERGSPQIQYGAWALHAGYIRLPIHTRRLRNTHCFPTATMVAQTRLSVTSYVHCLSCSFNSRMTVQHTRSGVTRCHFWLPFAIKYTVTLLWRRFPCCSHDRSSWAFVMSLWRNVGLFGVPSICSVIISTMPIEGTLRSWQEAYSVWGNSIADM